MKSDITKSMPLLQGKVDVARPLGRAILINNLDGRVIVFPVTKFKEDIAEKSNLVTLVQALAATSSASVEL